MEPSRSTTPTTRKPTEPSATPLSGELIGIKADEIDSIWPKVEKYIEEACEYSDGKWKAKDLLPYLKRKENQLFIVNDNGIKAVVVTEIDVYPRKKILSIVLFGGESSYLHLLNRFDHWAKAQGCHAIEIRGRPGWERLTKWKRIEVTIRKRLWANDRNSKS